MKQLGQYVQKDDKWVPCESFGRKGVKVGRIEKKPSISTLIQDITSIRNYGKILVYTVENEVVNQPLLIKMETETAQVQGVIFYGNHLGYQWVSKELEQWFYQQGVLGLYVSLCNMEEIKEDIILLTTEMNPEYMNQLQKRLNQYTPKAYSYEEYKDTGKVYKPKYLFSKIAVVDFGVTNSLLESLNEFGLEVTLFSPLDCKTGILSGCFTGILCSDGPEGILEQEQLVSHLKWIKDCQIPFIGVGRGKEVLEYFHMPYLKTEEFVQHLMEGIA